MAASVVPKIMRDGVITVLSGGGSPVTYTVAFEDGDFAFGKEKDARIVIRDRGTIVGVRKGESPVITGSFTVHQREFTDAAAVTLVDMLDKTGAASGHTSTGSGAYEEFMVDFKLIIEGSDHGDNADGTATFSKCIATWDFSEGAPNKLSVSFECFGGVVFTGQT
tara:strand:- start:770 stop:1264 length:495 start_codon:yes stop_codon:yes gene_type:complete